MAIAECHRNGQMTNALSVTLMVLALGCSVGAAISGIFFNVSPKIVGGLAALPPLIAFVAVNLKLEGKEAWHYTKQSKLDAIRSRLLYQLPEFPSADNIAAMASLRDEVNGEMQDEWKNNLRMNWNSIGRSHDLDAKKTSR